MTMPSAMQYQELISLLRSTKAAFDTAKDYATQLTESRRALRGVMHFLRSDPETMNANLTQPLAALSTATFQAGEGLTVPLLKHSPTRKGKPADTASETVMGMLAGVLDRLIEAKIDSNENLAAWVATEARRESMTTEDGRPIAGRQIVNWRYEIRRGKHGKASEVARVAFNNLGSMINVEKLRELRNARPHQPKELVDGLKHHMKIIIKSVAGVAPKSAPKQIDTTAREPRLKRSG
jgi:hypothetical protein